MAEFWEKVKSELDRAGKVAQGALDEGKLRIELFRVRQSADKTAETLGYTVFRARTEGREPEHETYSKLISTLTEQEAEIQRIEAEIRRIDANDTAPASASASPPPSGESNPGI
jgi:hypothetical protein